LLDQLGSWAALIAVLALAYRLSDSVRVVAAFLALRVGARLVGELLAGRGRPALGRRALAIGLVARGLFIVPLALLNAEADLWWAGALVTGLALTGALTEGAREGLLADAVPRTSLSGASALASAIERVCLVAGPLLGALVIVVAGYDVVFFVAATLLLVAAAVTRGAESRAPDIAGQPVISSAALATPHDMDQQGDVRERWALPQIVAGLLPGAIVAAGVQLTLVEAIDVERGRDAALLGILFAAVGLGALAGPLPIPRLLVRLPMTRVLAGIILAQAVIVVILVTAESLLIALPALVAVGLLSATADSATSIQVRRAIPATRLPPITRLVRLSGMLGQVVTLVFAIALIETFDFASIVLGIALCCAFAGFVVFVVSEGQRRIAARGMRA
jgi:hypothetical protein